MKPPIPAAPLPKTSSSGKITAKATENPVSSRLHPYGSPHNILQLQKTAGNRAVIQLLRNAGVIQGKFSIKNGVATDDSTGEIYFISATVDYGKGKKAYELFQFGKDDRIYLDTETLNKVAPSLIKKAKAPKTSEKMETDDSDVSDSDDDERSELTDYGKLDILHRQGKRKKTKMLKLTLERKNEQFHVHNPRDRKILAVNRLFGDKTMSSLANQETVMLGKQALRIGEGTGFFIQPGGNKESRPSSIKEPSETYDELFPDMLKLENDPSSKKLVEDTTGEKIKTKTLKSLSQDQLAQIQLRYMMKNAEEIEKGLPRTQLTENLEKAAMITGFSEFSRGMNAKHKKTEIPYDASVLVKQGLKQISEGKYTFEDMFYKGKGGGESIFMGAPSAKKVKKGRPGGSDVLQNPLQYPTALNRQMGIFPSRKRAFKLALRSLKSGSKSTASVISDVKRKAQLKKYKEQQQEKAKKIKTTIENQNPPDTFGAYDFLHSSSGFCKKMEKEIKKLRSECEKIVNPKASTTLDEAEEALKNLKKSALNDNKKTTKTTKTTSPSKKRKEKPVKDSSRTKASRRKKLKVVFKTDEK